MSIANAIYGYIRTRQPDGSGAEVYAFKPLFGLPLYTLPGLGTPYTFRWNPCQPEQLYYNQAQRMDGKIGIVAGQIALQPLIDNRPDNRGVTG